MEIRPSGTFKDLIADTHTHLCSQFYDFGRIIAMTKPAFTIGYERMPSASS